MQNQQVLNLLADSIGEFIEYWGFKKIHGRIWAMVYLSKEPISTPQIVEALDVSKGLISIAINELLDYRLIQQEGKTYHGAILYSAKVDMATVVRQVLRERELVKLTEVESRMSLLKALSKDELENANVSISRLEQLHSLTLLNKNVLAEVVKRNYRSIEDWLSFLKSISKVLSFKIR